MSPAVSGVTAVAAVVGRPVRHSLSPLIHNAWLAAAGIDGVYVALSPTEERFAAFVEGLRGGVMRGLNVTLPFKAAALAAADIIGDAARSAGAANLLLFREDGSIFADNTDGAGLLDAFGAQAPGFDASSAPVVVLGGGGAARGAAAALLAAGAPQVRLVNRTRAKAEVVREALGANITVYDWADREAVLAGAGALVNATSLGLSGAEALDISLAALPAGAPVMDMVYRPLWTPLLQQAKREGRPAVDGLEMLIRQAAPSFRAFFGQDPPTNVDVRAKALAVLESDA